MIVKKLNIKQILYQWVNKIGNKLVILFMKKITNNIQELTVKDEKQLRQSKILVRKEMGIKLNIRYYLLKVQLV